MNQVNQVKAMAKAQKVLEAMLQSNREIALVRTVNQRNVMKRVVKLKFRKVMEKDMMMLAMSGYRNPRDKK